MPSDLLFLFFAAREGKEGIRRRKSTKGLGAIFLLADVAVCTTVRGGLRCRSSGRRRRNGNKREVKCCFFSRFEREHVVPRSTPPVATRQADSRIFSTFLPLSGAKWHGISESTWYKNALQFGLEKRM